MSYIIKKDECKRLQVIFQNLIPAMRTSIITKDVENITDILNRSLPKLEGRAIQLSNKCIPDMSCPDECMFCNPAYIESVFTDFIGDLK